MVKALADRLAEAFAEYLHEVARREWYEEEEPHPKDDLIAERFRGIRPAFGYPACPDHSEKRTLFDLLDAEEAGIELTEKLRDDARARASPGLYLGHPAARYFSVGRLARDQVEDYARRKGVDAAPRLERWLSPEPRRTTRADRRAGRGGDRPGRVEPVRDRRALRYPHPVAPGRHSSMRTTLKKRRPALGERQRHTAPIRPTPPAVLDRADARAALASRPRRLRLRARRRRPRQPRSKRSFYRVRRNPLKLLVEGRHVARRRRRSSRPARSRAA